MDQSYRTFINNCLQQGEMIHISKEVDPEFDMSPLEYKIYQELGKSSYFTNIKGYPGWRAVSQLFCDRKKYALGLGIEEDKLHDRLAELIQKDIDPVILDTAASCQEVVQTGNEVDLFSIPSLQINEKDGGRYFASGICFTKNPDTGKRNISVHRQQIYNRTETGLYLIPRHARRLSELWGAHKRSMPIAMVFGVHPAIWYGGAFTTEFGRDELGVAGNILGEPVRLVKCITQDLEVPADAELVIEGEMVWDSEADKFETREEGPFGELLGTYGPKDKAFVFKATAITRRHDPIYYSIQSGYPITDNQATLALGVEIATKNHIKNVEGGLDIRDVVCHSASGSIMVVISMVPKVPGQAKTALLATLSGPYLHPKLAIAVDEDVDAKDLRQVMHSVTTRVHAIRDVHMIPDTRVFHLDNVSPFVAGEGSIFRMGTKWLIDATKPSLLQPEERATFEPALPANMDKINIRDYLTK